MTYKIEFQHKSEGRLRPSDTSQDQELIFKQGEFIPIPNVGDSVTYSHDNERRSYRVFSRHFSYSYTPAEGELCHINIVVIDLSNEEEAGRRKG